MTVIIHDVEMAPVVPTAQKILQYPNELLKTKCESGSHIQSVAVANDLLATIKSPLNDERSPLGLSSNQIGSIDTRVFVVNKAELKIDHAVYIDPVVTFPPAVSELMSEACMSFPPSVMIKIRRQCVVKIEATDLYGFKFEREYLGLVAQVMQHEIDHLNGITLYQNATPKAKKMILKHIELARKRR